MQVALDAEPWLKEPTLSAMPWRPYKFTRPLKIAVQWWDGVVRPHPPMIRAMKEVADACRSAGMKVVDWKSENLDHAKAWDIISGLYWPDGGKTALDLMRSTGEPVLPLTKFIIEEQPTVKNLSQAELWEVGIRRHTPLPGKSPSSFLIADIRITALRREGRVPSTICSRLERISRRRRPRGRRDFMPPFIRSRNAP